ncbi:ribulose-phosphate 3-epimerase [Aerococcus christensenii]|uniref:Ribulose-phosphate 3-epimerase n=1 Tax=Aerococcus christensenii TaxID=87541 RepID=A0A133Y523_9LACT|nr:ribulose-phosphate 3-epimerase [Aerococcus christensenii]KXB38185.1 putative ribulose-phosphate 3-epimerase [Aerococcus christensenii]MDK8233725.1 ribulose-phosphate 3-epimerase [Aerococcus christensenii]
MKEYILAPSLFSSKISRLEKTLNFLKMTGVKWLHVDVMDGCFVPDMASGPSIVKELKEVSNILLDVHLMIETPEKMVPDFLKAGADSITYHAEATNNGMYIIQMVKEEKKKVGVAINPSTPVSMIEPILSEVDLVLVMTINPGRPNKEFISITVNKIAELNQLREINDYQYLIEVDGKIDNNTIKPCAKVGADMFVSGGYIFGEEDNEVEMITNLKTALLEV